MLLTDAEIMDINQNAEFDSALGYAKKIITAYEAKLREQEPFCYHYVTNGAWDWYDKELPPDDAYDEGSLVPLWEHPAPIPEGKDAFPQAHRLALELECLILSCKDTVRRLCYGQHEKKDEKWK